MASSDARLQVLVQRTESALQPSMERLTHSSKRQAYQLSHSKRILPINQGIDFAPRWGGWRSSLRIDWVGPWRFLALWTWRSVSDSRLHWCSAGVQHKEMILKLTHKVRS